MNGKLLLRMPKSLHCRLAETAEQENVSLNQYILFLLSAM
jgi:antitoxin HicB